MSPKTALSPIISLATNNPYFTTIVPRIDGWIVQWYWNEPLLVKVKLYVAPGGRAPLAGPPTLLKSSTMVWVAESLLIQVTLPPFATVICDGVNIMFRILIVPTVGVWLDDPELEVELLELTVDPEFLWALRPQPTPPIINTRMIITKIADFFMQPLSYGCYKISVTFFTEVIEGQKTALSWLLSR